MATTRIKQSDLGKVKSKTDVERLKKMTDEEIEEAARQDPDSAVPTDEELEEFRPARRRPTAPGGK